MMSDNTIVTGQLPSGEGAAPPPVEEGDDIGISINTDDPLPPPEVGDNSAISSADTASAPPPVFDDNAEAQGDEIDVPRPPEA
jgi:hypothetical protein